MTFYVRLGVVVVFVLVASEVSPTFTNMVLLLILVGLVLNHSAKFQALIAEAAKVTGGSK